LVQIKNYCQIQKKFLLIKRGNQKDLDKSLNEAKNNIQTLQFIKSQLESDLQILQRDNDRLDEQIATLTAQVSALSSKKTPVSPEPVAPSAPNCACSGCEKRSSQSTSAYCCA
jgi:chromosome segregation ATPase